MPWRIKSQREYPCEAPVRSNGCFPYFEKRVKLLFILFPTLWVSARRHVLSNMYIAATYFMCVHHLETLAVAFFPLQFFWSIAAEGPDSIYKLLERTPTLFLTVSLQLSFPELLGFSVSCRQVVMKP
jgi:hypothetical protein